MRIDIITVVLKLLESLFNHSIIQRAKNKSVIGIHIYDLRKYGLRNYKQIDDTQFGNDGYVGGIVSAMVNGEAVTSNL